MLSRTAKFYKKNKKARDKKKAYDTEYNKKTIKERASRTMARRALERMGKVKKGDGMDVDHQNGNPMDNRLSNLKVMKKSKNRAKK